MAHEIFALIHNGVVANVVVGTFADCDAVAKASYGNNAFAIEVTRIPVRSGDAYHDGVFERTENGETFTIEALPTEADNINTLNNLINTMRLELDAVSLSVLDLVEMGAT